MATYIDLRSVQAEMVEDPRNCYRHCGYGAAMGGDERCRKGIMEVTGIKDWGRASAAYRLYRRARLFKIANTGQVCWNDAHA